MAYLITFVVILKHIIMNEDISTDWALMSDSALSALIGAFIKHHRLNQNKTQQKVSDAANISRSTMSLIEKGEKVMLSSLIRVMRVLDLLYIMEVFKVSSEISPIEYAKLQKKKKKQRVRLKETVNDKEDIGW